VSYVRVEGGGLDCVCGFGAERVLVLAVRGVLLRALGCRNEKCVCVLEYGLSVRFLLVLTVLFLDRDGEIDRFIVDTGYRCVYSEYPMLSACSTGQIICAMPQLPCTTPFLLACSHHDLWWTFGEHEFRVRS
jgi:hypothetical protein